MSRTAVLAALVAMGGGAARAAEPFGDVVFYFGEVHAHTGVSADAGSSDLEGTCKGECGTLAGAYADARAAGLDFAALTDHVNGINAATDEAYRGTLALAAAAHDPAGGFVSLPGAELWLVGPDGDLGHKTLLMFGDDATLTEVGLPEVQPSGTGSMEVADCAAIHTWAAAFSARFGDILLVPHHTAAIRPMPTDWSCHDPEFEPMVEVYSEHGSSLGDGTGYDPLWSGEEAAGTVHTALDPAGYALRFGFAAGSDKHNSRPGDICRRDSEMSQHPYAGGVTGVMLPASESWSRQALHTAMVDHRTLATSGPTLPVMVSFRSGGVALAGLGDDVGWPTGQPLDVEVAVPLAYAGFVTGVELVSPTTRRPLLAAGDGRYELTLEPVELEPWLYATVTVDGALWYGSATCDDGGTAATEYVWTSPSWLAEVPPDLDADGVTWAEGDCADDDATRHPGAEEVPDDGVDQDCDGADAHTPVDTADSGDPSGDTGEPADSGADSAGEAPTGNPGDDTGAAPPPCGCAGGARAGLVAALLAALSARRRALR